MPSALIALFSLTALTSAFLLFWVEPLFARMVLPLLGGSPAVWNTCLMYFQTLLLGGYLYAHLSTRYLGVRRQAVLHFVLLALTLVALPVAIPAGWTPPPTERPIAWLVLLLTVALGAPFFMLSATAPLLQRWLAALDDPAARDPYLLYAASNTGSFLGLLAFPAVLEPTLRLGRQSVLWSVGFVVAAALTGACVAAVRRSAPLRGFENAAAGRDYVEAAPLRAGERLRWIALAFVPSSLLLGVTTYLTTDVAAVPFLWVVPLAIYLLTFVVAFARPGRTAPGLPVELHALLVTTLLLVTFWRVDLDQQWGYPLHLGVFALTALVLHGELAARRPAPAHLTEFYLWMALGGALGGAFNALAAPLLFDSVAEYLPIVVLGCFLRPSRRLPVEPVLERLQTVTAAALPALVLAVPAAFGAGERRLSGVPVALVASLAAGAIALTRRRNALLFGSALAALGIAGVALFRSPASVLHAERSFFGAYRVVQSREARLLYHGTTIHGAQFTDGPRRDRPLTYYHPDGPAGQLFRALDAQLQGRRIGVVGLGAGSLLCYGSPGQAWTFYEIDPVVERIARDSAYFTFLRDCPPGAAVVLGDARLTLAREPDGRYALLVLDAFSSDAIPVHLLTREALAVYRRVLEPGGLLLVHISNQHLNLAPVVAALAADAGLTGLLAEHAPGDRREDEELDFRCDWVVLAGTVTDLEPLAADPRWRPLRNPSGRRPWTDDYSDVFTAIAW